MSGEIIESQKMEETDNKTQNNKKKKSKGKIILTIVICILILLMVGWYALTVWLYNDNLNVRLETYEPFMFYVEDFEGLERTEYDFPSDKGQMLAGYMYSVGDEQKGIIILAHGFGAGHNSYMDVINYLAQGGYYVFAYDATGNDASEGAGTCGAPQGVIDLDCAISFVEDSGYFPDLPIGLIGHSWGAYSVSNVLTFHPEVKAVIECCGFNRSSDMFESGGISQAGSLIYTMTPFVRIYEMFKFGKYATNTALDGFDATDAHIMCVHSEDDDVILIGYGYDKYYEKYKDDPRFTFVHFDNKGHNSIFNDINDTYIDEMNAQFDEWLETLDYDYSAKENKTQFIKDKADWINNNLDRERWCNRLDIDLMDSFVAFFDEYVVRAEYQ